MNGRQYFLGAIYATECRFSSPFDFFPLTADAFNDVEYNKDAVVTRLESLIKEYQQKVYRPIDQESALNLLIVRDLIAVRESLENLEFGNVEMEMNNAFDKYMQMLSNLGFEFQRPELFIVDELPHPYEKMSWFAFSADSQDEAKYGIRRGLYFLRRHLRPNYSVIMLGHELIHKLFSEADAVFYARGLEEGIANVLGLFYLAGNLYGIDTAKRYFRYMNLSDNLSQSSELYYEYTKQAAFLAQRYGFDAIVSLVKQGRKAIKDIEAILYKGDFTNIPLEKSSSNPIIEDALLHMIIGFVRSLVVSPLAYYISEYIEQWDTVDELCIKANGQPDAVKAALEELQTKISSIILSNNKITNSDLNIIRSSSVLRYKASIPK